MAVIRPPVPFKEGEKLSVFLAGAIDNGTAQDWQEPAIQTLSDLDIDILNPRRDEWDASWRQSIDNPDFKQQVVWELAGLEQVDVVLFNFPGNSQAPVSLLELGLCAQRNNVVVCCERNYWRRGNVEIICEKCEIPFFDKIGQAIGKVRELLAAAR